MENVVYVLYFRRENILADVVCRRRKGGWVVAVT